MLEGGGAFGRACLRLQRASVGSIDFSRRLGPFQSVSVNEYQ